MRARSARAPAPARAAPPAGDPSARAGGDRSSEPEESAETNGYAVASLILGIFWLFGAGSIAALVLGALALRQIASSGGRQGGRIIAIAGMLVGVAGLGSLALVIAFVAESS